MNSKRKDLQYASVFLLAVALTFLLGKGDNLWLVSWGDLIPSLFVLFIAGDCLHSSLLRIKRGEEDGGARWSTCFTFLVFSIVFMGDLFYIGSFIVNKLWSSKRCNKSVSQVFNSRLFVLTISFSLL